MIQKVLNYEWLGTSDILKIEETARYRCTYCFDFLVTGRDNAGETVTISISTFQDPMNGGVAIRSKN